jgi:hypothetical protein
MIATGAIVAGRGTFEPAGGWGGDHHDGVPIFILTRHDPDDLRQWPLVTYEREVSRARDRPPRRSREPARRTGGTGVSRPSGRRPLHGAWEGRPRSRGTRRAPFASAVCCPARSPRSQARRCADAIDPDRQLPVHDVPDLFVRVAVLVQRSGVGRDLVLRERQVVGVKEAPHPSGQRFSARQLARVDEGGPSCHGATFLGLANPPSGAA